jgi:hypothetical protein
VLKTNESTSDEIYFSIAEFSSSNKADKDKFYSIPGFITYKHPHYSNVYPINTSQHRALHWDSEKLEQLQPEILWKSNIKDNQSVKIFLSVVEHDAEPWDHDDIIGAIEIRITNKQGKLQSEWGFLNDEISEKTASSNDGSGQLESYLFKGSDAKYQISYYLTSQ